MKATINLFKACILWKASVLVVLTQLLFLNNSSSQTQTWQWAIQGGGATAGTQGTGIAVDASGNIFVVGIFSGTATFGSTTITSCGSWDIYVLKYDASGNVLWLKNAGGKLEDYGSGIALDGSGNVYITGSFTDTAVFDVGSTVISSGSLDVFIAKYNSSGLLQWVKTAGNSLVDRAFAVAVDISGNAYLTGQYYGPITFAPLSQIGGYGGWDIFVVKYSSAGIAQWVTSGGSSVFAWYGESGMGIQIDQTGNVFVTGQLNGIAGYPTYFGSIALVSSGGADFFIAKYDASTSSWEWAVKGGGAGNETGSKLGLDNDGNVYVIGSFEGTATFGMNTITSDGTNDYFVLKYDPLGNFQWVNQMGGIGYFGERGMCVDTNGNVYVAATFGGTAIVGTSSVTSTGNDNIYIAKFNTTGIFQWVKHVPGSYYSTASGITTDTYGNVFVTGWFQSWIFFGSISLFRSGTRDMYLSSLSDIPLPVMLTHFNFTVRFNNVTLKWGTAWELNNSGFEVERKAPTNPPVGGTQEWLKVGFVSGHGTTSVPQNYAFNDNSLSTGTYHYRLKQVDFNGSCEYFNLNSDVVIGVPSKFHVSQNYPNPSNPKSKIDYEIPLNAKVSIKLYDLLGRQIIQIVDETKEAGYYTAEFDGTNLASGVYFYRIIAEGQGKSFNKTLKMVLIK